MKKSKPIIIETSTGAQKDRIFFLKKDGLYMRKKDNYDWKKISEDIKLKEKEE